MKKIKIDESMIGKKVRIIGTQEIGTIVEYDPTDKNDTHYRIRWDSDGMTLWTFDYCLETI